MMMGFYPPGNTGFVINEYQKEQAVPPLDDFDWERWTNEMDDNWGVYALPGGTNIFPIEMMDLDNDYKLNVNVFNCPRLEVARMMYKKEIDTIVDTIKSRAPLIVGWIDEEADEGYQWEDFCENIMWIWNEYQEVAEELGSNLAENLEHFNIVCGAMKRQQMATWVELEASDMMRGA